LQLSKAQKGTVAGRQDKPKQSQQLLLLLLLLLLLVLLLLLSACKHTSSNPSRWPTLLLAGPICYHARCIACLPAAGRCSLACVAARPRGTYCRLTGGGAAASSCAVDGNTIPAGATCSIEQHNVVGSSKVQDDL
jgi:hypothetical protein